MGRPTKLTEDRLERICDALRKGVSIKGACELSGIGESTYYNWRQRGEKELRRVEEGDPRCRVRKDEKAFVEFLEQTTRAIADSEKRMVGHVSDAAPDDWRAAIELLQRRFPQRWSKKTNVDVTSGGEPVNEISLNVVHTTPEDFENERRGEGSQNEQIRGDGAPPQITDGSDHEPDE